MLVRAIIIDRESLSAYIDNMQVYITVPQERMCATIVEIVSSSLA